VSGPGAASRLQVVSAGPGQVDLVGVIDEAARIDELLARASGGALRIDLAEISYINSVGVRDWIGLLRRAADAGIQVELARVSEPVVRQFNMIAAARAHARIRSFFAPYACDACGLETTRLIDVAADAVVLRQGQAPAASCPACASALVLDDFPERYFAFLADHEGLHPLASGTGAGTR
jgi:anti-anti-sigma regulatory factor